MKINHRLKVAYYINGLLPRKKHTLLSIIENIPKQFDIMGAKEVCGRFRSFFLDWVVP